MKKAIAMNTSHLGVSEYTNWPFNSMATFNGKVLAADGSGLYEIGGEVDDGEDAISWRLRTHFADLHDEVVHRPREARVSFRSSGPDDLTFVLVEEEGTEREYQVAFDDTRVSKVNDMRVKFAKGLRGGRYWAFEVKGSVKAEILNIDVFAHPVPHRRR
jgi:hypothetical protein